MGDHRKLGRELELFGTDPRFYGPKIDVQVADSSEREATLSTVQVDFYQPQQFDLHYVGMDGARHRPVMVHRSIVGSMERAVAHLIERHGGAFPDWLAPEQLVVLPVTGALLQPAAAVARQAAELGLRARTAGPELGTLGSRIRSSRLVPYQAVIGEREAAAGQIAVRLRDGRRLPPLPAAAALTSIAAHAAAHRTELWDAAA
jgi:threonyl-tRNA synthetase